MYILKVSGNKFVILVVYVGDILLASNNIGLLYDTKQVLSKTFEIKDSGETSFVVDIEIYRNRTHGMLGVSQGTYLIVSSKVLICIIIHLEMLPSLK